MNRFDPADRSIALVVDDNPDSIGMVSSALEAEGMTVLVARDGQSAIDLTHRVDPDVILLDAVMPDLDGFETCRMLKSGPKPTPAPIIFMTGLSEPEHVVKGLRAGGVDYITKPVVIEEMVARLTTHVVNSRLLQSVRQAVEVVDRPVLAFDTQANLVWGSERAMNQLGETKLDLNDAALRHWLINCVARPVSEVTPHKMGEALFHYLGYSPSREILVKLTFQKAQSNEALLQEAFGLTAREAEVLFWLTLGKTNRDISSILSLSSRTVNKHFEQVFQKMGVDNRTSAAVLADRRLHATGP